MTFPKIKWHVERNMYSSIWYTIIAEVDLGSARYREMHTISQNEIDELYSVRTLWKIIEKMQWNMLDALGYYEGGGEIVGFDDFCKNMMKDFGPHADWLYLESRKEIVGYTVDSGEELVIPNDYLIKKYIESINSSICKCCGR